MGTKLRCMDMSDGVGISIFVPVVWAECAVPWPRWRKARQVQRRSVLLHLLPSARSPHLIFWTFCIGGDKRGYGITSRSQAAPAGLPKLLLITAWWRWPTGPTLRSITRIYAPQPLCWNAPRAGAGWSERFQRHQRRLMHIVGNSWGWWQSICSCWRSKRLQPAWSDV